MRRLVLATSNPDKTREIEELFRGLPVRIVRVTEVAPGWLVDETAGSLEGNALLKARAAREASGEPAIADDTGLFVAALGGAPGVRSARFAGPGASYADNVRRLLDALAGRPAGERIAVFRTAVALVRPDGGERVFVGELEGRILEAPRGEGGFGYDPVFHLPGEGVTLAEMPLRRKNEISHRARAFRAARDFLENHPEWLGGGGPDD
ncbi:MAG TPA: RdgB/HAM1 family non-canonical purine NTP pyrophosphatase [Gemmatimonadota bacterium]|nr:RdgB/HAM1 family non-canonical purine NTP pyrophosphatase [Gemmatimonadota bacterium]